MCPPVSASARLAFCRDNDNAQDGHESPTNLCLCAQLAPPGEKQTGLLGRGRGGGGVVAVLHVYHNLNSIQRWCDSGCALHT